MTGEASNRDRSQAYTLEGVFAAIAILTALLFGLQVVDFGPWTGDTTQETSNLETRAEDMLDVAAQNGALSEAVRCYPIGKEVFDGTNTTNSSAEFEQMLHETFDEQDRQYNIYFTYMTEVGERNRKAVSSNRSESDSGVVAPTDSAAVATRTVAIFDDEHARTTKRYADSSQECGRNTSQEMSDYDEGLLTYEDAAPNSSLFNVVEVRVVVW